MQNTPLWKVFNSATDLVKYWDIHLAVIEQYDSSLNEQILDDMTGWVDVLREDINNVNKGIE